MKERFCKEGVRRRESRKKEGWRLGEREGGTSDQKLESRGKPARSGSMRQGSGEGWGSPGKVRVRAEWRHSGCLELEAVLVLPGPWPLSFCLPSTFPTSPPRCPPPNTPGLTVSLRSGKSEGADSQQRYPPPLWWHSPCLFPQSWVSPPPPPPLPPLTVLFPRGTSASKYPLAHF